VCSENVNKKQQSASQKQWYRWHDFEKQGNKPTLVLGKAILTKKLHLVSPAVCLLVTVVVNNYRQCKFKKKYNKPSFGLTEVLVNELQLKSLMGCLCLNCRKSCRMFHWACQYGVSKVLMKELHMDSSAVCLLILCTCFKCNVSSNIIELMRILRWS
jgi:hypothetical protein